MTEDPKLITLGGADYPIAPMTLKQMRFAMPAFGRLDFNTPDGMAAFISIIQCGLSAANPDVTVETVEQIRGITVDELLAARKKIADLAGVEFKSKGEAVPAEAPAQS